MVELKRLVNNKNNNSRMIHYIALAQTEGKPALFDFIHAAHSFCTTCSPFNISN